MNQAKGFFAKQNKQENKVYSSNTKAYKSTKLESICQPYMDVLEYSWESQLTLVSN